MVVVLIEECDPHIIVLSKFSSAGEVCKPLPTITTCFFEPLVFMPDLLAIRAECRYLCQLVVEVDAVVNLLIPAQFRDRVSSRHKLLIGGSG